MSYCYYLYREVVQLMKKGVSYLIHLLQSLNDQIEVVLLKHIISLTRGVGLGCYL